MYNMGIYINSWLAPDTSSSTSAMQANFDALGSLNAANLTKQNTLWQQITADSLGLTNLSDLTTPTNSPRVLSMVPSTVNINSMSYATVLGTPPVPKGTTADPYQFIQNASGLTLQHVLPSGKMAGPVYARTAYANYYETIIAIESFDAYVLSSMWAENQNGNKTTTLQNTLIPQASNSTWLAQVASEELGKVLRQLLVFQSQSYVVLTQLLQVQKQLLAATAMNNTLLIANNSQNEKLLLGNASGKMSP
jgi:hypothetical protein